MNEKITPIWKNHPERQSSIENKLIDKTNNSETSEKKPEKEIFHFYFSLPEENHIIDYEKIEQEIVNHDNFSGHKLIFFKVNPYQAFPNYKAVISYTNRFRKKVGVYEIVVGHNNNWKYLSKQ